VPSLVGRHSHNISALAAKTASASSTMARSFKMSTPVGIMHIAADLGATDRP
jgi:hypothetical protein